MIISLACRPFRQMREFVLRCSFSVQINHRINRSRSYVADSPWMKHLALTDSEELHTCQNSADDIRSVSSCNCSYVKYSLAFSFFFQNKNDSIRMRTDRGSSHLVCVCVGRGVCPYTPKERHPPGRYPLYTTSSLRVPAFLD